MRNLKLQCLGVLLACNLLAVSAQTTEWQSFEQKGNEFQQQLILAFKQSDYQQGERLCKDFLQYLSALSDSTRLFLADQLTYEQMGVYYNLACFQSLQGKTKEGIRNLELACENGFEDYRHLLTDNDLDNLRAEEGFRPLLDKVREKGDYLYILQQAPDYVTNLRCDTLPVFEYPTPDDRHLAEVRQYFRLDSVAGSGDELSQIKNILTYIHNRIKHDGQHENPEGSDIIRWAEACKDGSRGLNCGGLANVLNECYLAMGFQSRFITCLPKKYVNDCHSINAVYSRTLGKWVWMDPTNNAWVMDEHGTLLGIGEVRERLRKGLTVVLNAEANWNNQSPVTADEYLYSYMAKNLYAIQTAGSKDGRMHRVLLVPSVDNPDNFFRAKYVVNDAEWFWQAPNR